MSGGEAIWCGAAPAVPKPKQSTSLTKTHILVVVVTVRVLYQDDTARRRSTALNGGVALHCDQAISLIEHTISCMVGHWECISESQAATRAHVWGAVVQTAIGRGATSAGITWGHKRGNRLHGGGHPSFHAVRGRLQNFTSARG